VIKTLLCRVSLFWDTAWLLLTLAFLSFCTTLVERLSTAAGLTGLRAGLAAAAGEFAFADLTEPTDLLGLASPAVDILPEVLLAGRRCG
jgi:hypothetical protein